MTMNYYHFILITLNLLNNNINLPYKLYVLNISFKKII